MRTGRLDISRNLFRALPVQIMNEYMPNLQALDVSHNRLEDMARVQELGLLKELRELNLLGNPLVVVNQRVQLIASLLFDRVRPSRERLEALLQLSCSKGRAAKQENVPRANAHAHLAAPGKPKIIASESTSRMLVSGLEVGQVLPSQAVKVLTSTGVQGTYSAVIYADLTPAPVPRPAGSPFRYLSTLNLATVTKEDLDQAARVCSVRPDALVSAHKKKPKKLKGKAKQQQLERDLQQIELDRRQRKVDKALAQLLRTGQLEQFRPGLNPGASPGSSESSDDGSGSGEEFVGEENEASGDEETLDEVHDKCVNPVSVCKALMEHLRHAAASPQPSARESPTSISPHAASGDAALGPRRVSPSGSPAKEEAGNSSMMMMGNDDAVVDAHHGAPARTASAAPAATRRATQDTQGKHDAAALAFSASAATPSIMASAICALGAGGSRKADAHTRDESAGGGKDSVSAVEVGEGEGEDAGHAPKGRDTSRERRRAPRQDPVPRHGSGWATCPAAWWEQDGVKGSGQEARQAADLPTRLSVVEMGEDELQHARGAVAGVNAVVRKADAKTAAGAAAEGTRGALPVPTEEEIKMRKESQADWQIAEEVLDEQEERVKRLVARTSTSTSTSSRAFAGASMGETLKLELPQQRDYDSTLLQRRLPLHFKRLKLDQFLAQDKDEDNSHGAQQALQTADVIGKDIDALFTRTNIRNKLEASATGSRDSQRSIAWEQKKMRQHAQVAAWEQRLSAHQQRLRVLNKGGWPHPTAGLGHGAHAADERGKDAGDGAMQQADKGALARGVAGTAATNSTHGSKGLSVTKDLVKELTRIEKIGNPEAIAPAVLDVGAQGRGAGRVRGDAGAGTGGVGGGEDAGREAARRGLKWRVGGDGAKHERASALQCSIDTILLMRRGKGTEGDASSAGAGGATMFRKDVVKQMRSELGKLHQSLAHSQVFYSQRTHSIVREHILQSENTFYSQRTHSRQTSPEPCPQPGALAQEA